MSDYIDAAFDQRNQGASVITGHCSYMALGGVTTGWASTPYVFDGSYIAWREGLEQGTISNIRNAIYFEFNTGYNEKPRIFMGWYEGASSLWWWKEFGGGGIPGMDNAGIGTVPVKTANGIEWMTYQQWYNNYGYY